MSLEASSFTIQSANAVSWLYSHFAIRDNLRFDGLWAWHPVALEQICLEILEGRIENIVDLGSGLSTLFSALAVRERGYGVVVSVEEQESFAQDTQAMLRRFGVEKYATVHSAPVIPGSEPSGESWYSLDDSMFPQVGLLLVDGPRGASGQLRREPALGYFWKHRAPHLVVYFDDVHRPEENFAFNRWVARFGPSNSETFGTYTKWARLEFSPGLGEPKSVEGAP